MAQKALYRHQGHLRDGSTWMVACEEIQGAGPLQTGTSRGKEFIAKMFRLERREDLRGLLHVLFNIPPATHLLTLTRQSSKGPLVLHQSGINNRAKYHHPNEPRYIHPQEIAQGICHTWEWLLTSQKGFPPRQVEPFLVPGEDSWMFWAGALVRRYHLYTEGGVVKGAVR